MLLNLTVSTCGSVKECSDEGHHRILSSSGFLTNSPFSSFDASKSHKDQARSSPHNSHFNLSHFPHHDSRPPSISHYLTVSPRSNTCGSFRCPWLFLPGLGQHYTFAFIAIVRQRGKSSSSASQFKAQQAVHSSRQTNSVTFTLQPLSSTSAACHELASVIDKRNHVTKGVTVCGYEEFKRRGKDPKAGLVSKFVLTSSRVTTFVSTESSPIEIRASQESTLIGSSFHVVFILAYNCE